MSASINDGGPAFPSATRDGNWQPNCDGMTLRDWFAGQALAGILVSSKASDPSHVPEMLKVVGGYCYLAADAMLAARNKEVAK